MLILARKISEIILKKLEKSEIDKFVSNLNLFCDILSQEKKLVLIMSSPQASIEEKQKIISNLVKVSKLEIGDIGINLLVILMRLNKMYLLREIIQEIEDQKLRQDKITKVKLSIPSTINKDELEMIEDFLAKKYSLSPKFEIDNDEELMGGFRAFFDGKMLDLSVLSFFDKLRSIKVK